MTGVNEIEIQPGKYDSAALAAQIRQLSQEIRELSLSRPVAIFNGNSSSSGGFSSYLMPAAALGAMGYCYMWWKGLSFSDVMFVTKHNMANVVSTVSKQLENVSEALAVNKRVNHSDWRFPLVLGDGLVSGVGKSTLMLQIAGIIAQGKEIGKPAHVLYVLAGSSLPRQVNGVQASRADMIISVLMKQAGLKLQSNAIFLKVVSGATLTETAGGLPVAAAIRSRHVI
ncbi:hypothetical protein QVD17_14356 [Tagetes erecta]|uniref:DUF1664 domain-containing protein n=1 Tax=Tagetes erecta TaxID=13708 RepID=A0AAD8NWR5_TARER|nr:hypothetical protein QVD17_14356 [Tagetes erecta]